jgi:hypothetical protein
MILTGFKESEYGLYSSGTFRIQGETDEAKQPIYIKLHEKKSKFLILI